MDDEEISGIFPSSQNVTATATRFYEAILCKGQIKSNFHELQNTIECHIFPVALNVSIFSSSVS